MRGGLKCVNVGKHKPGRLRGILMASEKQRSSWVIAAVSGSETRSPDMPDTGRNRGAVQIANKHFKEVVFWGTSMDAGLGLKFKSSV